MSGQEHKLTLRDMKADVRQGKRTRVKRLECFLKADHDLTRLVELNVVAAESASIEAVDGPAFHAERALNWSAS